MRRKNNGFLKLLSFFGIILAICITTIGYSTLNAHLTISGEASVKVNNSISIVAINVSSTESDAYEQYNNSFGPRAVSYHITLPNSDSTITYKIDIRNRTKRDYGIALINGLPDNLTYEFINYTIGDRICTGSTCNNGAIDEIYIKIKYKPDGYDSANTTFSGTMNIDFEHFYSVVYKNVTGSSSLKQTILKNTIYSEIIPIPADHKLTVRMNGVLLIKGNTYSYDENTNELSISNVTGNIVISIELPSTEFDLTNTGGERAFSYTNTGYDINTQTFYLEADFSVIDMEDALENIISIGNDFSNWAVRRGNPKGVNLHVFYPSVANVTGIQIDLTSLSENNEEGRAKFNKSLDLTNSNLFRLALNANGLYINGYKIFDANGKSNDVSSNIGNSESFLATFFDYWQTNNLDVGIGSAEGDNRSNAIYNEIKIYDNLLTPSELIEKTKVITEEKPITEEITYNSASAVKINNNQPMPLIYPFEANNNKFTFTAPSFTNLNSNSLYFEIDVSNLKENAKLENLMSLGNDFTHWIGANVFDFHVYYPYTANSNTLSIALLNGSSYNAQFRGDITLIDDRLIKILLSKRGLYINGEKWIDLTGFVKSDLTPFGHNMSVSTIVLKFFEKFTYPNDNNINFIYGSEQGDGRSSATYNDVRIYNGTLTEEESIELTS